MATHNSCSSCLLPNAGEKLSCRGLPGPCAFSDKGLETNPLAGTRLCRVQVGNLECSIGRPGRQWHLASSGKGLGPRGASDGQVECGGRPAPSGQVHIGGPARSQAHLEGGRTSQLPVASQPCPPMQQQGCGQCGDVWSCRHLPRTCPHAARGCQAHCRSEGTRHRPQHQVCAGGGVAPQGRLRSPSGKPSGEQPPRRHVRRAELGLRVELSTVGGRSRGQAPPHALIQPLGEHALGGGKGLRGADRGRQLGIERGQAVTTRLGEGGRMAQANLGIGEPGDGREQRLSLTGTLKGTHTC